MGEGAPKFEQDQIARLQIRAVNRPGEFLHDAPIALFFAMEVPISGIVSGVEFLDQTRAGVDTDRQLGAIHPNALQEAAVVIGRPQPRQGLCDDSGAAIGLGHTPFPVIAGGVNGAARKCSRFD